MSDNAVGDDAVGDDAVGDDAVSDDAVSAMSDDAVRDDAVRDDAVRGATCDSALDGDPDEDVTGDAGLPICGECARSRDFFVLDLMDGDLDGAING